MQELFFGTIVGLKRIVIFTIQIFLLSNIRIIFFSIGIHKISIILLYNMTIQNHKAVCKIEFLYTVHLMLHIFFENKYSNTLWYSINICSSHYLYPCSNVWKSQLLQIILFCNFILLYPPRVHNIEESILLSYTPVEELSWSSDVTTRCCGLWVAIKVIESLPLFHTRNAKAG